MKLTVIGGGGMRAPLFVSSALRRAKQIGLDELCLMDNDAHRLGVIGDLCRQLTEQAASPLKLTTTTDARRALEGADYVVTTVRVGGDMGRVLDERIALRHGVLGQETTGPGGFAMALRNIPAIERCAEWMAEICPNAWLFNFTNPAGLVAQALHQRGFSRAIGICDGANVAQNAVAAWLGVAPQQLRPEVFGLNHLSWTRRILLEGQDVLAPLLRDPKFLSSTAMKAFDPELVAYIGMWFNEYLFYYYYAERAVEAINQDEVTRGEEVLELNRELLAQLQALGKGSHRQTLLDAYFAYEHRRNATYMYYARPGAPTPEEANRTAPASVTAGGQEGEGYAGVALDVIEAFQTNKPLYTALNIANQGALDCLKPDDVVEVSCIVENGQVRPLPIGTVPEHQELLIRAVKRYERLTVEAIHQRSRALAVQALMAHPLVLSYSRATALVDEYLAAHREFVGEWH